MTDLHYGVRYPNGGVTDYGQDRDGAHREATTINRAGGGVELVCRRVSMWKRSTYQPPVVSNTPGTGSDTASDRGRPGHDTEGNR